MTEEIIIDGELSCNNCLEKTKCKQQQEVKKQRIDAILSYIANEDNEKYIAELKNEIPAITRCDIVLEKQLKRLERENKKLKKDVQLFKCLDTFGESECHCACRCLGNEFCGDADKKINTYRSALEEIREIADVIYNTNCNYVAETHKIIDIIREVLND